YSSEALPLREVLPQQAVEVLVAPAFPWSMRIGEVAAYTRRFFQLLVAMELGSVVPGNGLEWQTALSDQSQHDPVDGSDCPMRQFLDQTEPGAAINQSQKAVALSRGTHVGVAFPVAGFLAAFNNVRSAIDHRLALQAAPLFRPERALPPTLAALPEVAEQASTSALVLADVAVDGHVTDARIWVVGQVVGDLFRTPLLILQKIFDAVVDLGRVVLYPSRAAASTIGVFLGLAGHVQRTRSVVVDGGVAPDLPADGEEQGSESTFTYLASTPNRTSDSHAAPARPLSPPHSPPHATLAARA